MNNNTEEEVPCIKCSSDVLPSDRFCRHCGIENPGTGISWDWKAGVPWGRVNVLLKRFGCQIVEIETGSDQYAAQVVPLSK